MTRTCDELGVCQKQFGKPACPQCDEEVFECEVPCSPEPPQPTYPFAPGVIQGPDLPIVFMDTDGPWIPMTLADTLKITATVLLLGFVAGYLVERLA